MRNVERVQRTRGLLIEAARKLFTADGFAATPTEAILAEAGVTRGAMYHHFADKAALFEAVCEEISREIGEALATSVAGIADPADALEQGLGTWLGLALAPGVRRILLIEAPTVLGPERWNRLDEAYSFSSLREGVAEALASGSLRFEGSADMLATLINGASNAMALRLGAEAQPDLAEGAAALRQLVAAFRPR